jgi:hypothetical protein
VGALHVILCQEAAAAEASALISLSSFTVDNVSAPCLMSYFGDYDAG